MRKILKTNFKIITNKSDLIEAIKLYKKYKTLIFFDTETTGLNIKYDTPFLLPWGFLNKNNTEAFIFCVDIDDNKDLFIETARVLRILASQNKGLCGHNIKYDLHMLNNIGVELWDNINYIDTMVLIRLAHNALTPENGGPPLGLKEYSAQYIDRAAKTEEKLVKSLRTDLSKRYNKELKEQLYKIDRKWTLSYINDYFKDILHNINTLDNPKVKQAYQNWFNNLPKEISSKMITAIVESKDIPYNLVDRATVTKYAMYDIVWTMEVYLQCWEAIMARKNKIALIKELTLIPALVRMESCGFYINKDYVIETTKVLENYIRQQRDALTELVGEPIAVNQNKKIKDLLINKYKLDITGTGKDALERIYDELKVKEPNNPVIRFIGLIQEIRTLEKWYSTYLLRFIREIEQGHTRIYTQINQVGTVSGRVTSDFQQFPKYGINKEDGSPLFHPRKMVLTTPGFKGIAYLDYSQVELRLQALYTILVGSPDTNLCRAYMPYKCCHIVDDGSIGCGLNQYHFEDFDYNNPEHIAHAYDWDWYYKEDLDKKWIATDVHAATTHVAFPDIPMDSDEFKKLRGKVGKRVNFAKNYGAQFNRIKVMFPDYDDETIHKIDDAYYTAFPGVKKYHEYCYKIVQEQPYVSNLFGVKYYGLTGHKLINCLVQGSGAYLLKERIFELDKFIQTNKLKSRMQMQIHDEISFEIYPGEEKYIKEFKRIMQDIKDTLVPIVADLEFTETTWADKEEVNE